MLEAVAMAAILEHVDVTDQVGFHVGLGVLDRMTHPRLGGEVDDPARLGAGEGVPDRAEIGKLDLMEGESRICGELREPVALELHRVIVVEAVEPDHLFSTLEQPLRGVEADEAGRAGHDIGH